MSKANNKPSKETTKYLLKRLVSNYVKKHFSKLAKRKDRESSYNTGDQDKCVEFIKDKLLFHKFGKFTVIEGLSKGKSKLLLNNVKKYYKIK